MSGRRNRGTPQDTRVFLPLFFVLSLTLYFPPQSRAQGKSLVKVDEDVQAFAIAPDNRIVYSVQHMRKVKKARLERDDLWISSPEGRQKKIVDGEIVFEDPLLSLQVQSFVE